MTILLPQSAVFDYLQAEYEAEWLGEFFVLPDEFAAMLSNRSLVVYGGSGSGKTALRLAFAERRLQPGEAPERLLVSWQPTPEIRADGTQTAQACFDQILREWAWTVLRVLGREPARFTAAPLYVQNDVRYFVQLWIPESQTDADLILSRLSEDATSEGQEVQHTILLQPARPLPPMSEERLIAELVQVTQKLGFGAIWVLADRLERLSVSAPDQINATLKSFFSMLPLFEHPALAVKLVAPPEFEPAITSSSGIARRRIAQYHLRWSEKQLEAIVARRIALLVGQPAFDLEQMYERGALLRWLAEAGSTPFEWLERIRPLAQFYAQRGLTTPIDRSEWLRFAGKPLQKLRIDLATNRVFVGNQEIRDIQATPYRLLLHLYTHRERICTRSELYHLAHRGRVNEPRNPGDKEYESPKEYESALTNAILRLREAIEPDPRNPMFVVTIRGRGVKLEHAM